MPTRKKKVVGSKMMGIAKASKSMGATSTKLFNQKGTSTYCPKVKKLD